MSLPSPRLERSSLPSIAIVGNDAFLAAAPATPIQLAHACLASGFDIAIPGSWGDELIAAEVLRQLPSRDDEPAVMCSCPHVASRVLAAGSDLAAFLISLVSPPVAAARYVRALYEGRPIHVTYIGACPSADDPSIDARLTPDEFLVMLAERNISLATQPQVFDSVVPPDRRRWCSLPGGLPVSQLVAHESPGRSVVDIRTGDFSTELAQSLVAGESVLIDLAPRLACPCSGARAGIPAERAREAVMDLEPPRASAPIIEPEVSVSLSRALPAGVQEPEEKPWLFEPEHRITPEDVRAIPDPDVIEEESVAPAIDAAPEMPADDLSASSGGARRRTPTHAVRHVSGGFPRTRAGERSLPRAYVGKRRGSGTRHEQPVASAPSVATITPEAVVSVPPPATEAIPADLARALSGGVRESPPPPATDPADTRMPRNGRLLPLSPPRVVNRADDEDVPVLERLRSPFALFLAVLVIALAVFVILVAT
jgi:hypothetical protein